MVNIEGEIQKIIHSQLREVQPKKNDRWRAGRVTLPCEWGRHCSTMASHLAWRRKKRKPSIDGGGGEGGFTVALTKHGTTRCLSPPKIPPLVEYGVGGGQGVFTVASPKHGTAHRLPPSPRKTHALWNGGGGLGVFTVALPKHGTECRISPPLTSPWCCPSTALNGAYPPLTSLWRRASTALNVAYPHTNHTSCPGKIKLKIRLTYFW